MLRSAGIALRSLSRTSAEIGLKNDAAPAIVQLVRNGKSDNNEGGKSGFLGGAIVALSGLSVSTAFADSKCDRGMDSSQAVTLFQYDVCPWCNKVKAVLDYNKVPYRAVEVHPLMKSELKFSPDYKKVPIMITASGEQINDSNEIIQHIMGELKPGKKGWFGSKSTAKGSDEQQKWQDWADDKLVKLVTVNIYRSWGEAYQAMDYVKYVQAFSALQQTLAYYSGGAVMYFIGAKLVPKYGLEGKDLREELRLAIDSFIEALGQRDFMGGNTPGLADLHVFGIIRAVSNTDTFQFVIHETKAFPWWQRMVEAVGESSRIEEIDD
eukprot:jgi/Ulvmu1/3007/UM015_0047.1